MCLLYDFIYFLFINTETQDSPSQQHGTRGGKIQSLMVLSSLAKYWLSTLQCKNIISTNSLSHHTRSYLLSSSIHFKGCGLGQNPQKCIEMPTFKYLYIYFFSFFFFFIFYSLWTVPARQGPLPGQVVSCMNMTDNPDLFLPGPRALVDP